MPTLHLPSDRRPTRRHLLALTGLGAVSLLTACDEDSPPVTSATTTPADGDLVTMTVFKDVSCGCCTGWVTHAEENGFAVTVEHPDNLATVWTEYDIPLDLQSCHLALTKSGDYFIGHVPAKFVHEYLAAPPAGARGLSVPRMPVGTPGMEQGDQFDPYEVLLLTDGEPQVYAEVTAASQQV